MKLLHGNACNLLLGVGVEIAVAATNCAVGNVDIGVK
jgi:hypothetical protein